MNRLIIIGASGHGRVVADIAKRVYDEIIFLDNNPKLTTCAGYPVLGSDSMLKDLRGDVFVAVGKAEIRKRLMNRETARRFPTLIHPSAVIADDVELGAGTVVMAGAVINPGVRIGRGCIVNTSSSIDHDCALGDFVHVSVGTHLCGTVRVGENVWIGAGSAVINNVNIRAGVTIGAGAVVVRNIEEEGVYVGTPARIMKKSKIMWGGRISGSVPSPADVREWRRGRAA